MREIKIPPLSPVNWLNVMKREYFCGFLQSGGSAAKFVLGDELSHEEINRELKVIACEQNFLTVNLSADVTKLYLMQEIFFGIARALPWEKIFQNYIEDVFKRNELVWPAPGHRVSVQQLSEHFEIAPGIIAINRDKWLSSDLWDDPLLARDFRSAAIALSLSHFEIESASTAGIVALSWLCGEKQPAAALREADIEVAIGRTNARSMLLSLCHFIRKAGFKGLFLTLDLRPALRRACEPIRYSPSAVMDMYEVFREIIDDLENLSGLFLLGVVDQDFISGDPKRTIDTYKALEMRIWPDVRPGDRQSPLAPLVMVSK